MNRTYYIGEGEEALKLINECEALRKESHTACAALVAEFGAEGLLEHGTRVCGFVFNEKQTIPCLKFDDMYGTQFGYVPKKKS